MSGEMDWLRATLGWRRGLLGLRVAAAQASTRIVIQTLEANARALSGTETCACDASASVVAVCTEWRQGRRMSRKRRKWDLEG